MDRNQRIAKPFREQFKSLSARRAWIEMDWASVISAMTSSLSARRAWIEIFGRSVEFHLYAVALRKESVDRNRYLDNIEITQANRRSPQGERG